MRSPLGKAKSSLSVPFLFFLAAFAVLLLFYAWTTNLKQSSLSNMAANSGASKLVKVDFEVFGKVQGKKSMILVFNM